MQHNPECMHWMVFLHLSMADARKGTLIQHAMLNFACQTIASTTSCLGSNAAPAATCQHCKSTMIAVETGFSYAPHDLGVLASKQMQGPNNKPLCFWIRMQVV